MTAHPAYRTIPSATLEDRARRAVEGLGDCRACPRDCRVDRLANKWSACKTGRHAVVSSYFPHFGEEDCLRGRHGSGTIFFAHCNLRCVFCQNYDISQGVKPGTALGVPPEHLARMMLELQHRGCHNVNFVTPEHVAPQILEALVIAIPLGLHVPLVYNTSAYDAMDTLRFMDGVVDIYMPDIKCWSNTWAKRYLKAEDYPEIARRAILEMHRQVGTLALSPSGLATRGVLIRHLVMPGAVDETARVLRWIADALGPGTYVNLMDQYRPAGQVGGGRYPELARRPEPDAMAKARRLALELGLRLDEPGPRTPSG